MLVWVTYLHLPGRVSGLLSDCCRTGCVGESDEEPEYLYGMIVGFRDPNFYLIQTNLKDFYGKLWNLQLPAKIAITIWRIFWNYIPTLANLKHKRVSNDAACPRCGRGEEDITHIFRYCPATGEIWPLLDLL
ncbi:hypothetical protein PVK06_036245 [Gossypium arboreum]|uniref:Reverse transcriptase zinc-binding domain-containing protein n=1 Tax=Gossypium arboreum TaxID=29729 RepID=A0ABR0NK68_GOSAR|nr:hypothetical protein PVK06_036245 [Gossypium arboreum]